MTKKRYILDIKVIKGVIFILFFGKNKKSSIEAVIKLEKLKLYKYDKFDNAKSPTNKDKNVLSFILKSKDINIKIVSL
ncbi:hypothetical protein [Clostridium sardiniense]|uniref:hypothetical protein n=1 Tax=Clostridium sardiniense TaxID=29369 RepID=UPI003D354DE3